MLPSSTLSKRIAFLWVLADLFCNTAGLKCYHCSEVEMFSPSIKYSDYKFASGDLPTRNNHCPDLYGDWPVVSYENPRVGETTSDSTQPTCEKSTRMLRLSLWTNLYGGWETNEDRIVYRKCSSKPLPNKSEECFHVSENVTFLRVDPKVQPYNLTFDGVTCLCATDGCNNQPGIYDKDNNLTFVPVPTTTITPIPETKTTTSKHFHENEATKIENVVLAATAWPLVTCFLRYISYCNN